MKKRDLTLERKIGICVLGLFVFLAISCSQDVLAADIANNVVLSVKASTTVAAAGDVNRIFYQPYNPTTFAITTGASIVPLAVATGWTEKAVYNGASPDIKITVLNKVAGDLIIKADFLTATTPGAIGDPTASSGGALTVSSRWLKFDNIGEFNNNPIVTMVSNGAPTEITSGGPYTITIDPTTLKTLVLNDRAVLPANTTQTLYSFTSGFKASTHVIFTAVLVNSATAEYPQVLGVDVQSIFFNYIPQTGTWYYTKGVSDANTPIWLDLITAVGGLVP